MSPAAASDTWQRPIFRSDTNESDVPRQGLLARTWIRSTTLPKLDNRIDPQVVSMESLVYVFRQAGRQFIVCFSLRCG
jgi:hypothetical protein